jgi:peptidyl-tRNA hydrolase
MEGDKVVLIYLVRTDLKMSKGQIASRVADVTQYVIEECIQRKYITYTTWKKFYASRKIVLKVSSLREFYELHSKLMKLSHELSFPIKIVKDDQKIKIVEDIPTVLAFGPIKRNKVEHIVADLKLL